jgi:peptide/nickel transport system substrate-binding protein
MMHHNMARPNMGDVHVRKAIDFAIDRNALSQSLGGGMGTRSLFPDYTPYFLDDSDPHGDANAAAELLDAAGWALEGGKRMKNGQELTIKLVAYPQRPGLVTMQPVIADALTAVGITVESVVTSADSWDELDTIMADGDFDLLMWAQNTLPAGDPAWFLNAFFRSDGGSNYAGLDSADVDSLLDELSLAEKHGARVAATAAVHIAILTEVPISNLVTPRWHISVSDRLIDYEPWGSDYYVIRAEGMPLTPTSRGFEGCDDDHDHDHDGEDENGEDENIPVKDSFAAALTLAAFALYA